MNIEIGFHMFRLRQLTGIPLIRLAEVTVEISFSVLSEYHDLRDEVIKSHSIRTP